MAAAGRWRPHPQLRGRVVTGVTGPAVSQPPPPPHSTVGSWWQKVAVEMKSPSDKSREIRIELMSILKANYTFDTLYLFHLLKHIMHNLVD